VVDRPAARNGTANALALPILPVATLGERR
jgi:hypothetical protein